MVQVVVQVAANVTLACAHLVWVRPVFGWGAITR